MLTLLQLIPQANQEQERTRLLKKVLEDFQKVVATMDKIHKDCAQHIKDTYQMKVEVAQMWGKAVLESHKATSLWDMINVDRQAINQLISVTTGLKSYVNQLGEVEMLRERLCLMDLWIARLQMRLSTDILEDQLARLEDWLQDQHEEITILRGQICCCGQEGTAWCFLQLVRSRPTVLAPPVTRPRPSHHLI